MREHLVAYGVILRLAALALDLLAEPTNLPFTKAYLTHSHSLSSCSLCNKVTVEDTAIDLASLSLVHM